MEVSNMECTTISDVGAELKHADGQTDVRKLMGTFREYTNAPQNDGLRNHTVCAT
jgi:hypothetical protein